MKKLVILALAVAALVVLLAPAALAATDAPFAGVWVYTNDDNFGANTVSVFSVSNTGMLTYKTSVSTNGSGSGGGYYAHTIIDGTGDCLYAANSGSNNVAVFTGRSTGNLTLMGNVPTDTGTLALNIEAAGKGVVVVASDSGTVTSFKIGASCALTKVDSRAPGSSIAGSDGGKGADGKFYVAATINGSTLYVIQIDPTTLMFVGNGTNTTLPGCSGCYATGVTEQPSGNNWFVSYASFGTDVDSCTPMGAPSCTHHSIAGGGSNSNTIEDPGLSAADGLECLYVGNQSTSTVTAIKPDWTGVAYPTGQGGSIQQVNEAYNKSRRVVGLVSASGPDNTVATLKVGAGCTLSTVDVKGTGQGGYLMSTDVFEPGS